MFSRTFLSVSYRVSSKSTFILQNVTCHRSLHVACRNLRRDLVIGSRQSLKHRSPVLTATFVRYIGESSTANATLKTENVAAMSTSEGATVQATDASQVDNLIAQIPEPPTPIVQEVIEAVSGEPTLQSLGLGGWSPAGLVQQYLDFLHVSVNLPWWATILITTICVRTLLLPVVIRIQRFSAKMHNVQPQIQYLQNQLSEARKMGDRLEAARLSHELYEFMKQKGVSPIKNAALPLLQAPVFLSFFWALRGMVQAPVESMKEGGLWWFTDLTVPDPYYLLPIITSMTLAATIEMGTDAVRVQSLGIMRYVIRASPYIMFPFIMNFEGAILCYWVSTNMFSLVQVSILRIPKVREFFKIPATINHDPKKLPVSKKNFVEGFKDSWTNLKVARELTARDIYDENMFEKAGKGAVPKTFKYDPTKRHPVTNTILSKKRD
ncbi:hypothetical protein TSAR_005043 [Trichomalopsis sarcophagae]|uniref:Membrane insertase YidC/Oxa/ALB C-terminal domain-containing protein n=1 Tax=Trichomalopsis sarcophagae TaxID=543379 RepID=A0A232F889_9HYME|nr:hypothetical protein TSAR_005043 [Trichomalopsis sarcophagae]